MFEKFSNLDIDSAGSGGEYTVQAGFGWTNGVVLWVANTYGNVLDAPNCPNITGVSNENNSGGSTNGATSTVGGAGLVPVIVSAAFAITVSGMVL
jgi:alpha,alpha-trehalase